jgi:beta-lactamase class A
MIPGLFAVLLLSSGAPPEAAPETSLVAEFARMAPASGGTVGVSAIHIESGERAGLHNAERFPMMSVYKLPIALALLHQVEGGKRSLGKPIAVGPSDMRLGHSPLADHYPEGGINRTVGELLEATLVESDNTASDLLLREVGGAAAVTARLSELGVGQIRVDRPEAWLALDGAGIRDVPPEAQWTLAKLQRLFDAQPASLRAPAMRAFVEDPRDTATPDGMADLLALTFRGKALNAENTRLILDLMTRTIPGPGRLKGRLPAGTPVAHRTGLSMTVEGWTGAINDIGILTLPDGAGHVAIAVFVKGCARPVPEAEDAIARIGRAAFDHWTRSPKTAKP